MIVVIGKNDFIVDCWFENYMGYVFKGSILKGVLNVWLNYLNLNDFMMVIIDSIV